MNKLGPPVSFSLRLKTAAVATLTLGLAAFGSAQTAYGYGPNVRTANWARKVKLVVVGLDSQLTISSDGVVRGYGSNTFDEVTIAASLVRPRSLAAGNRTYIAAREDGSVFLWGQWASWLPPPAIKNVVSVAMSTYYAHAIASDGTVYSWGDSFSQPPHGLKAKKVVCGANYSVALRADGTLRGWGRDEAITKAVPSGQFDEVASTAIGYHVVALRKDGVVVAWGRNTSGQCTVPAIPAGRTVKSVVAGLNFSAALLDNGQIVVWGDTSKTGKVIAGPFAKVFAGAYDIVGVTAGPVGTISLSAGSVVGGSTSVESGKITLEAPAEDNLTISLKSSHPAAAQVPPTVTIPKGGRSATFAVDHKSTAAALTASITATSNDIPTVTQSLLVKPNGVESLTASTALLDSGTSATGTVTLVAARSTATTVTFSATGGLTAPATVVVDANSKVASFPISSSPSAQSTNGQIIASYNGVKKTLTIPVVGQPLVRSLDVPSGFGLTRGIGKVTLSTTARFDKIVTLKSSSVMTWVPATVTVPAGQSTVTFTVEYADVPVAWTVKVTANGFNSTLNVQVTVTPNVVASMTLPATVSAGAHGTSITGTVILKAAVSVDTVVNLESTIAGSVPPTVRVPAGAKEAHFIVKVTGPISKKTNNTITATRHGVAVKKVLTINP